MAVCSEALLHRWENHDHLGLGHPSHVRSVQRSMTFFSTRGKVIMDNHVQMSSGHHGHMGSVLPGPAAYQLSNSMNQLHSEASFSLVTSGRWRSKLEFKQQKKKITKGQLGAESSS